LAKGSRIRLLFDETIGDPVVCALAGLLRFEKQISIEAQSMRQFLGAGTKDSEWVGKAAAEEWFVITGDRGKKNDGAPLDLLLPFHGISGAFLTGRLHGERSQFEKMRAILVIWPHLLEAIQNGPRGVRYKISIDGSSFGWRMWPLDEKASQRQVELLGKFPENLWEAKKAPRP
jgi:hypothetical protein